MTRYQLHLAEWSNCTRCELYSRRSSVVLYRGTSIPCDVVFIGEAPGASEDSLGDPFVGPAGHLLDQIIESSLMVMTDENGVPPSYMVGNLIGCIPYDEDRMKIEKPPPESVKACSPRLAEFVRMCDPKLLILLGKEAADWTDPQWKASVKFHRDITRIEITHPAAILRAPVLNQSLMVRRCVVAIQTAIEQLRETK